MTAQDYADGAADGLAGREPDVDRLALGANRLNDYERGYIDSGDEERRKAMANPVLIVRTTRMYGEPDTVPPWRTCWMWCPGCDHAVSIPIAGEDGTLPRQGPHWTWDGNLHRPTFDPSILQHASGRMPLCHSFVRAGRWEFLGDCQHALVGQTVDMVPVPDWLLNE